MRVRLIRGIAVLAILNLLSFLVISELNGGTAGNGYELGSRFFLGSHGDYRETTAAFFSYSIWHERAVWSGMAVLAIAFLTGVFSRPGN